MYHLIVRRALLTAAVTAALGLTACGGGGSSSGGDKAPATTGVSGVTLSGTVAKGIVNKGLVVAQELSAAKEVLRVVGNAVTGVDGTYTLTLSNSYEGGPVQITISTDENTQMKCDVPAGCGTRTDGLTDSSAPTVIDFGEWYKPAALSMAALIPNSVANAKVSVNVTPFTNMAAVRAKASATLDVAAIANANSEVSNLLGGIDVLNTAPIDITDPAAISDANPTETTYAALASALANTGLVDSNGQPDIAKSIELLANSFAAGTMVADDSGGDDAAQISLQEIVTAAGETLSETGTADMAGVIDGLQSEIDTAVAGDGTIDPQASETAGDTNLAKAKAMMADVRTWGNVISLEVGNKGELFGDEIDLAGNALDALDISGGGVGDAFAQSVDAAFQRVFDGVTSTDLKTYVTDQSYSADPGTGNIIVTDVTDFTAGSITLSGSTVTISNAVIYGHTVNLTISIPQDATTASVFTLGIQSATVVNAGTGTSMTVSSGTVKATLAADYTIDVSAIDLGTAADLPKVTDLTINVDVSLTQSKGVDAVGQNATLASPVTFAGTLNLDLDPVIIKAQNSPVGGLPVDPNQGALPKSFTLTGSISNATNSMNMSLSASVDNTDTFQFIGDFSAVGTGYSAVPDRGEMVTWVYSNAGEVLDFLYPDNSIKLVRNTTTGAVTITWVIDGVSESNTDTGELGAGYASLGAFVAARPYLFPSTVFAYIDGEGEYVADLSSADLSVDGSVDGLLEYPEFVVEDATNWIDANVGLTFTAQLAGLPEARINITADRTAFKAGTASTTVSYGTRQLAIAGSIASSDLDVVSVSGTVTITNQDNIKLTISDTNVDDNVSPTGTLSFNGVDYATVTDSNGLLKVTYTDGTFEIF